MIDISLVLTAHHEGLLASFSYRSLLEAATYANNHGISTETLIVLDQPSVTIRELFTQLDLTNLKIIDVAFADQGRSRNEGVKNASGKYVAFLDGDDLWSENWLEAAFRVCEKDPQKIIAHPEFNWFFGEDNSLFLKIGDDDRHFDAEFLRTANYWDSMCVAPRQVYLDHPFHNRDIPKGYAYEDWHWSCETLAAGYRHRLV